MKKILIVACAAGCIVGTSTPPCSCSWHVSTQRLRKICINLRSTLLEVNLFDASLSMRKQAALQAYSLHRVLMHNACVMRRVEKSQGSRFIWRKSPFWDLLLGVENFCKDGA